MYSKIDEVVKKLVFLFVSEEIEAKPRGEPPLGGGGLCPPE
jgi:hypothetical protein